MFPVVHGAVGLVAAGSRDSCVYVWRRRSGRGGEEGRSMRDNVMYTMDGHKVMDYTLNVLVIVLSFIVFCYFF